MASENEKWPWLLSTLSYFVSQGSVLIFVSTKVACEELSENLNTNGFKWAQDGVAHTLITTNNKDINFSVDLIKNLEGAGQPVPKKLFDLAMQNPRFQKLRVKILIKVVVLILKKVKEKVN